MGFWKFVDILFKMAKIKDMQNVHSLAVCFFKALDPLCSIADDDDFSTFINAVTLCQSVDEGLKRISISYVAYIP